MSFQAAIEKRATERYMLARITPSRYIGASLTAAGGGLHTMSFPYPLAALERNGVALTRVTATPVADDTWMHDEATGTLTVKLAMAPSDTLNVLVAFYWLFFTNHEGAILAPEDPMVPTSTIRLWEPRIVRAPTIRQSFANILAGVLTIEGMRLELANADNELGRRFTDDDSLHEKTVDLWLCLDSVDQAQKVYQGCIASVESANSFAITLDDKFVRLKRLAYMGDTSAEAMITRASYPSIADDDVNKPIRYVVGRSKVGLASAARVRNGYIGIPPEAALPLSGMLDWQRCEQAVLLAKRNPTISATTNRGPFMIARTSSAGFKTLNFGTIISARVELINSTSEQSTWYIDHYSIDRVRLRLWVQDANLEVGDSFTWSHPSLNSGNKQYAVVMGVWKDLLGPGADQVDCMMLSRSVMASTVDVKTGTFNTNQAPALILFNSYYNRSWVLCYELDFTYTIETTSGGNKMMTVTLKNSFEPNTAQNYDTLPYHNNICYSPDSQWFDPDIHKIHFRVSQATAGSPALHGSVVKEILERNGLTVDATSVAAANAALPAKASFTIPFAHETVYSTGISYMEALLASTLGYLKVNPSTSKAEYHLLSTPSPTSVIDENTYTRDGVNATIDHRDLATEIIASNGHIGPEVFLIAARTLSSAKAKYLHTTYSPLTFEHGLEDIEARLPAILSVRAQARTIYRFKTATKLLDAVVGDDVTLESKHLLGGASSRDLKIIGLTKSTDGVEVEAVDLPGL